MEQIEATFWDWCQMTNYLADKNKIFQTTFMAAGGNYEKMSEVENMDDETIESNIKLVSSFLEINPRHHPKIGEWAPPKIEEVTVEQWFSILELLEANNSHILLYPNIFAILASENDVEKVKEATEYTKLAETVSFFLLNIKESLSSTQNFSAAQMKTMTKLIYKFLLNKASLKTSTQSQTEIPSFSTDFLHGK